MDEEEETMIPERKAFLCAALIQAKGADKVAEAYNQKYNASIKPNTATRYGNMKPSTGYEDGPPPKFFTLCMELRNG